VGVDGDVVGDDGSVVGGVGVVVVGFGDVTLKVCGVYCVVNDGKPSVKHAAVTTTGATTAPAGTVNDPCQAPPAVTGTVKVWINVEVTRT
jgi:hypothetical protein